MANTTTLSGIISFSRMAVDILIMTLILYYALKIVRNNSRTMQIFKGIVTVIFVKGIADFFGFKTVSWIADSIVNWGFLAVIIIFQPEIRGILEKLGKSSVFSKISTLSGNEREALVDELVKATMILSKDQTGALICLEHGQSMNDYIKTGTQMNSVVTAELLTAIFVTSTPLHDGAVIIQGDRLACASAYFPPTNLELPSRYGARHRAAIGISEITDSITIVVSEETGNISVAEAGKLMQVDTRQLREYLLRVVCDEEIEVKGKGSKGKKGLLSAGQPKIVIEKEKSLPVETVKKKSLISKIAIKKQHVQPEEEQPKEVIKDEIVKDENVSEEIKDSVSLEMNSEKNQEGSEMEETDLVSEQSEMTEAVEHPDEKEEVKEEKATEINIEIPFKEIEKPLETEENRKEDKSMIFSIFKKKEEQRTENSEDVLAMLENSASKDIKLPKHKKKEASHSEVFNQLSKDEEVERDYQAEAKEQARKAAQQKKDELNKTVEIKVLKEQIDTSKLQENKMKVVPHTDIASEEFSVQFLNDLRQGKRLNVPEKKKKSEGSED